MKREWVYLLLVLLLHYIDTMQEMGRAGIQWSDTPFMDFQFLLYHATFYLLVIYVLIPKLFYQNKFILFFLALFGLMVIYAVIEEEVLEKILDPKGRGHNPFSSRSVYFFIQENIAPLLAVMGVKFVNDSFERQRKLEQIEKNSLTNELKFLKSQIQPHILFNSLNSLYEYTLSKSDKAPELVLQLSGVLRYVLYETSDRLVPLNKELDFIKDYIALQEMQLEGRGKIKFDLSENTSIDDAQIAPYILIPFIENSFKHSLGSKEEEICIVIKITVEDQSLQLLVENNFESNTSTSDTLIAKGIGLKNVQKRLDLLYPNRHQLEIQETSNFYKVLLQLELE